MEVKNRSFQYGKYRFRTSACMPHLEARRGRYQPSSCVLCPLSQNLSWCRSPCRYLELPNWFIEPGVKINGAYYCDVLLGQHLVPAIRSVAGDFFTYNAPTHRAGDTVKFLSRNTPDFISSLCRSHPVALI